MSDGVDRVARTRRAIYLACAGAAVAVGTILAIQRSWICDDAYITFRYADHLVRGHGLVFNPGERVEGYTNLLWTLWTAVGLAIGVRPEAWTAAWGIACFAAALALLARRGWQIGRAQGLTWPIPVAALLGAAHAEWVVFATSGLETSAFTLLVLAGTMLVCPCGGPVGRPLGSSRASLRRSPADQAGSGLADQAESGLADQAESGLADQVGSGLADQARSGLADQARSGLADQARSGLADQAGSGLADQGGGRAAPRRLAIAGAVLALASLTRPDGVLFAAVCGVWILGGRDVRGAIAFAAGFLLLWLPATIWRVHYYGDLFPNTYYAKSASIAWWSQGWFYAQLYFTRYWPLLAALALAAFVRPRRVAVFELALVAAYAAYVMRVGGDFMFGRLLVPLTPLLLLLLQRGLIAVAGARALVHAGATAALLLGMVLTPSPVTGGKRPRGIADEHDAYTRVLAGWAKRADQNGARLAVLFDGLPVSVGFFGAQARLVYRSRVATAIECETGLTDATIARQPLTRRGRVGHEKHARLSYLLERHVQFVLARDWANKVLELDRHIPDVQVVLGGVRGRLIAWNPAVVAGLRSRGAVIPDVPAQIDAYIAKMSSLPDDRVRRDWERYRRLYFDHVSDEPRAASFRARLEPAR